MTSEPARSDAGKLHKKQRAARRQRARQRALRLLAEYHVLEFERLLKTEYEIEGLERVPPPRVERGWSRFDD